MLYLLQLIVLAVSTDLPLNLARGVRSQDADKPHVIPGGQQLQRQLLSSMPSTLEQTPPHPLHQSLQEQPSRQTSRRRLLTRTDWPLILLLTPSPAARVPSPAWSPPPPSSPPYQPSPAFKPSPGVPRAIPPPPQPIKSIMPPTLRITSPALSPPALLPSPQALGPPPSVRSPPAKPTSKFGPPPPFPVSPHTNNGTLANGTAPTVLQHLGVVMSTYHYYGLEYRVSTVYCADSFAGANTTWLMAYPWVAYCAPFLGGMSQQLCGACLRMINVGTGAQSIVRIVDECGFQGIDSDYWTAFIPLDTDGRGYFNGHIMVSLDLVAC